MGSLIDLHGRQFGRWTVLRRADTTTSAGSVMWVCQCVCGTVRAVNGTTLRDGTSFSCGCLQRERVTTHGMHESPEYASWGAMRRRCTDPGNKDYAHYGARGIKVCDRWESFADFYADMGPRPSAHHTLDRIDVDGNYEPGNCRWATSFLQAQNRSMLTTNTSGTTGVSRTRRGWMADFARNGRRLLHKRFGTRNEAVAARRAAEAAYAAKHGTLGAHTPSTEATH